MIFLYNIDKQLSFDLPVGGKTTVSVVPRKVEQVGKYVRIGLEFQGISEESKTAINKYVDFVNQHKGFIAT